MERNFYVYILTNERGNVMYVGVTNDLLRRVREHREHLTSGFTSTYNVRKLVHFEHTDYLDGAKLREKQIKGWTRAKKEALVTTTNPGREDLFKKLIGLT